MTDPVLTTLGLWGFRSLSYQKVSFDNPTFFVGRNGAGKSNLTDIFSFLAEAMSSSLQVVLDRRGGYAAVSHRYSAKGRPPNIALSLDFGNLGDEVIQARYHIDLRSRRGTGFEVAREYCWILREDGQEDRFDRKSTGASRWDSSVAGLQPDVDGATLVLPLIGGHRRFRAVSRFLSNMRTYQIEPEALRTPQDPDGGIVLQPSGRNIASVLREIRRKDRQSWQLIKEILEVVVPGTVDVQSKRQGNKLTLEFSQSRLSGAPVRFDALAMSDGTLRVLGLLAAVFQQPPPSLLVIEEPEASVHPGATGAILDVIRLAAQKMQVVVTTHSPDILDAKWIDHRHLCTLRWQDGVTCIGGISETGRKALQKHLMGAGELLRSEALIPESDE